MQAGNVIDIIHKWEQMLPAERLVEYKARTQIFAEGAAGCDAFILADGLVALTRELPNGSTTTATFRFPGDLLGHWRVSVPTASYGFTAIPVVNSKVLRIQAGRLRSLIDSTPDVADWIIAGLHEQNQRLLLELVEGKTLTTAQRFESLLPRLMSAIVPGVSGRGDLIKLPLPDVEIAHFLGVSAEHFSRLKKKMIKSGQLRKERCALIRRSAARRVQL